MNKLIVTFFLLNVLNIYCQLNCGQYTDTTCGGYTSYKLKCHKSGSNCVEIEVDDGCTINDSNQCIKENGVTLGENEICFNYGVANKCRRIKHQCTSYIDSNCGGFKGTIGSKQCTKMSNDPNDFCTEIVVDQYCEVNSLFQCIKRSNVTEANFAKKYSCLFNKEITTCKREAKVCSEQLTSNCGDMMPLEDSKKCRKVKINNSDRCKEITESDGCSVSNEGVCSGTVTPTNENQKCGFNAEITTCGPIAKTCEDYTDNCSGKSATCHKIKVGGTLICKEVEIDEDCEIDDKSGECQAPDDSTDSNGEPTHACIFNNENTICKKISICEDTDAATLKTCNDITLENGKTCSGVRDEEKCKIITINANCDIEDESKSPPFDCVDKGLNDENQKCDFNEGKTECRPRAKTCEEYTSGCKGKTTLSNDKTCSIVNGASTCKEVQIEDKCTIDEEGNCKLDSSSYTSGSCAFNEPDKDECNFKRCNETNIADCESTTGCGYYLSDGKGCREVTVGDNCKILNGACLDNGGNTDTTTCLFNYEITQCIKRDKICRNYFESNCGNIGITSTTQCYKFSDSNYCKEIQVDDKCNVDNNEECVKRSGVTITEDKICHFTDNTQTSCKLVDKKCEEYTTQTCQNLTYTNPNKKCFYSSGRCYEIEIDNYCTVDQSGNCVEKDDSSLSDTETCDYYADNSGTKCKKRNMVCNELDNDICENYTPINNKFCFKFEDSTRCKEVTVEDGCQMNSSNQCVAKRKGDACSLDENNNRCYKTKSGASLLNLKLFSLLILFFIC